MQHEISDSDVPFDPRDRSRDCFGRCFVASVTTTVFNMQEPEMTTTKRWTIFVLTGLMTFAVGVFVASLHGRRSECRGRVQREQCQWEVLLSFLNRDLSKLDQQSNAAFRHAVDSVTAGIDRELTPLLTPRVFRLVSNTTGQQRYLLVEEANSMVVPGTSFLRLLVFDLDGRILNAKTGSAYRELFTGVHVGRASHVPGDVVIVETVYVPFAAGRTRQFYALVENGIRLVYIQRDGSIFNGTATSIRPYLETGLSRLCNVQLMIGKGL